MHEPSEAAAATSPDGVFGVTPALTSLDEDEEMIVENLPGMKSTMDQAEDLKNVGNNLFVLKKFTKAIQAYTEAIKLNPNNERFYSNRAAAYIAQQEWDLAIADAEKAIELNPSFAKAFTRLGTALKGAELYERAQEAYTKVLAFLNEESTDWEQIKQEIAACIHMVTEKYRKEELAKQKEEEEKGGETIAPKDDDLKDKTEIDVTPEKKTGAAPEKKANDEEEESEGPPDFQFDEKYKPTMLELQWWITMLSNPGNISNIIGFSTMIVGLTLGILWGKKDPVAYYFTSVGLYAFAGGITNWIAIQMLWEKVYYWTGDDDYLIGTGIIIEKYEDIRDAIKDTVMTTFFDETYLNWYVKDKLLNIDYTELVGTLVDKHGAADKMLEVVLPDPTLRSMLAPSIGPLVKKAACKFEPELKESIKKMNLVQQLSGARSQIDIMLDGKLKIMTPEKVKSLMEDLIASELFYLVIWGNIFGGGLGAISAVLVMEFGIE